MPNNLIWFHPRLNDIYIYLNLVKKERKNCEKRQKKELFEKRNDVPLKWLKSAQINCKHLYGLRRRKLLFFSSSHSASRAKLQKRRWKLSCFRDIIPNVILVWLLTRMMLGARFWGEVGWGRWYESGIFLVCSQAMMMMRTRAEQLSSKNVCKRISADIHEFSLR